MLSDLQRSVRLFDSIGAVDEAFANVADAGRATERARVAFVTANTFSLIGVQRRELSGAYPEALTPYSQREQHVD